MTPEALSGALSAVAPFFGIIFLGWFAAARGWFKEAENRALNHFVFAFALPPLLFRAMSQAPDVSETTLRFVAVYGAATVALYVAARLLGRAAFGLRGGAQTLFGHASLNGNVGFLGLPLAIATLGPGGALPTALILTVDILVIMTLTILSLEAATGRGGVFSALRRALLSPILIASLGGFAWGVWGVGHYGLALPDALASGLDILGQAAAPGALFAVGAMLAGVSGDRRAGELGAISLVKLIAHPALVLFAIWTFAPDTPPIWIAAAALAACCPSSNNGAVFAQTYGVYQARAAAAVLVTSVLGLPVYVALVAWLASV